MSNQQKTFRERQIEWEKLKPVYFPQWVWFEVCKRFADKYKYTLPVYQGQKVIMT